MTLPGTWGTVKIVGMIALALVLAFTHDEEAESPEQATARRSMVAMLWIMFAGNVADAVLPPGWSTIRTIIWGSGGAVGCVMIGRLVVAERRELRAEREAARLEAGASADRRPTEAP